MSSPFSAVLLAGGKSTRMGRDKAFIEIDGLPLWRRQLGVLEHLRATEIFIAGPRHAEWTATDSIILPDARNDAGPLAGLVAALRQSSTRLLVALAIDLPNMTHDYLQQSLHLCGEERGVVPTSLDRFEPLAAVYPLASLRVAEVALAARRYSLQDFVGGCVTEGLISTRPIQVSERSLFLNLNTPVDLAAALTCQA